MHIEQVMRQGVSHREASDSDVEAAMQRLNRWNESSSGESVYDLKKELQTTMQNSFGVFRTEKNMQEGIGNWRTCGSELATHICQTSHRRLIPRV